MTYQGRNEVYGIRDHSPGIWNHNAWDWDQQYFSWNQHQGSNFCGFRDQNSHHFWNEGLKFWVKIWDQLRKNIPRYDPDIWWRKAKFLILRGNS